MKFLTRISIAALVVLALPLFAQNSGPSANGDFQFSAGGFAKSVVFNVRTDNNGATSGQMSFVGAEDLGGQDVDEGGDANPGGQHSNFSLTVNFDCLKIKGKRAVAGGVITESSVPGYIGLRALLVVEDGGEGSKEPRDRYAWGVYRSATSTWVASDAELEVDLGVGLQWTANDAERDPDDEENNPSIPSHPTSLQINCGSFPVDGYDLQELFHGFGNIQVKP